MCKTWKSIYLQNRRGNEQSQQIPFETFRQKEVIEIVNCSAELNAFLSFLRTCEESNRLAILTENDMDRHRIFYIISSSTKPANMTISARDLPCGIYDGSGERQKI